MLKPFLLLFFLFVAIYPAYGDGDDVQDNIQNLIKISADTAIGVGSMKIAQGVTEKQADASAAQNMSAYTNAIQCRYGNGTQIKYGETVTLPTPSEQFNTLREQYLALAQDIKEIKERIGIKPGIESIEIISTDTLYKNENNSENTPIFETVEQRIANSKSDETINTGIALVVGGIAANLAANALKDGNTVPQSNNISTTAQKENPVEKEERPPEQVSQDNEDELCQEFPDEPECQK